MRGPARFEVWDALNTTKMSDAYQIESSGQVDDVWSDTGLITITIGADDEAAEHVADGNHLRAYLGTQLVHTARIEAPIDIVRVDPLQSKLTITLKCRGHIAIMEEALIGPFGGPDAKPQSPERPHKWSSPETDISGWLDVTILYDELAAPWVEPQTDPPWFAPWYTPVGMSDPAAQWMGSRPIDPEDGHPVGECPFVADVELENAGLYRMEIAVDDGHDTDVNGMAVASGAESPGDSFVTATIVTLEMSAGSQRIGILGKNFERPATPAVGTFGGPNVLRVAFAMYYLPDGENTVLSDELVVLRSGPGWKTLAYPSVLPAPTDGAVIMKHVAEQQADGALVGVTLGFDAEVDSGNDPWPQNGAQSFQVDDDDLLTMLQTMHNAGRIDYRMDRESLRLDVWKFGQTSAHPAEWTVGTGLQRMTEQTQRGARSLRVRHRKGRFVLGTGFPQRSLKLADLDEDAAREVGQRHLDALIAAASSFEVELELGADAVGTEQAPYGAGGPRPGDSPKVSGDRMRMERCVTSIDAAGWPTFKPVFETRAQGAAERSQIALARATSGTLNGRSRSATPVDGLSRGIVAGFAERAETITFTQVMLTPLGLESVFDVGAPRKWERRVQIHRIDLMQFVPPQTVPTVAHLVRSGPLGTETVATLELPVGFFRVTVLPAYLYVGELDAIHLVVASHDTAVDDPDDVESDARWLSFACNAVFAGPAAVKPPAVDVPW